MTCYGLFWVYTDIDNNPFDNMFCGVFFTPQEARRASKRLVKDAKEMGAYKKVEGHFDVLELTIGKLIYEFAEK